MCRKYKTINRNCNLCGAEYEGRERDVVSGRSKYCSAGCARKANGLKSKGKEINIENLGREVQCKKCGKVFYLPASRLNQSNYYCSQNCRKTGEIIQCKVCGRDFYSRKTNPNSENLYCSRKCYGISKRIVHKNNCKCVICGKEFRVYPYMVGRAKYCSQSCMGEGHADLFKSRRVKKVCKQCKKTFESQPRRANEEFCSHECYFESCRTTIICEVCGKERTFTKSRLSRKVTFCCSAECAQKTKRKRISHICLNCGKEYERTPHCSDRSKYCSRVCQNSHMNIKYPRTRGLRRKVVYMNNIKNIDDWYVKSKIQRSSGISFKDIPEQLIELKRLIIKRKRKLKEITHGNSQ